MGTYEEDTVMTVPSASDTKEINRVTVTQRDFISNLLPVSGNLLLLS